MLIFTIAFLIGINSVWMISYVPNLYLLVGISCLMCGIYLVYRSVFFLFLFGLFLGIFLVMLAASYRLQNQFPAYLEGKTIHVWGTVASIPVYKNHYTKFLFEIDQIDHHRDKKLIQLEWYDPNIFLHVDEYWDLPVRLKRPHGLNNEGGFDYERWCFEEGISAIGYVLPHPRSVLIKKKSYLHNIEYLRQNIQDKLYSKFKKDPLFGFLPALIIGSRQFITNEQWDTLKKTGTNHLIAIAGLHVGIVVAFLFVLTNFLWKRVSRLSLYIPAHHVGTFVGLIGAVFYSLLAGVSVQTQRAMIMLMVVSLMVMLRRVVLPTTSYLIALFLVLWLNPLDVLQLGFWMSFVSVALIIYGVWGRIYAKGFWWHWGRIQWILMCGLMPLTLLVFHEVSFMSVFANMIAVPWFTFLIVPLCFLSGIFLYFMPKISYFLLWFVLKNLKIFWFILSYLAKLSLSNQGVPYINGLTFIFTLMGVILFLLPKGFFERYLVVFYFLPLFTFRSAQPVRGEIWFTLLDVGQGLSAIVQKKNNLILFDTGPRFNEAFNAGEAVILPFLFSKGIQHIDRLIVSHGDNDHIGGSESILARLSVSKVLTSIPRRFHLIMGKQIDYCHVGQSWKWDGIYFKILWPKEGYYQADNNSSCVLRVSNGHYSVLLTGDIEAPVEKELLGENTLYLKSTIMIAPHHGSQTSSSEPFVEVVYPQYVLYPVGYRNRFHFPSKVVEKRYQKINTVQLSTAQEGEIGFQLSPNKGVQFSTYRRINRHIWNNEFLVSSKGHDKIRPS